jgi:cell division protein FtsL
LTQKPHNKRALQGRQSNKLHRRFINGEPLVEKVQAELVSVRLLLLASNLVSQTAQYDSENDLQKRNQPLKERNEPLKELNQRSHRIGHSDS